MLRSDVVRRRITTVIAAGAVTTLGLVTGGTAVHAYPPPQGTGTVTKSCTAVAPGQGCTISFHFDNTNGQPEANTPVTFTLTGQGCINPKTSQTDAQGNVSTTYTAPPCTAAFHVGDSTGVLLAVGHPGDGAADAVLAAAPTTCGTSTVTAATSDAAASATVTFQCSNAGQPLPFGSTDTPGSSTSGWMLGGIAGVAVLVLGVGAVLIVRRRTLGHA